MTALMSPNVSDSRVSMAIQVACRAGKWFPVAAGILLLIGCQGTDHRAPTDGSYRSGAQPPVAAEAAPQTAEITALMGDYMKAIMSACSNGDVVSITEPGQDAKSRIRSCFRRQIQGSFGDQEATERHCPETDLSELTHCVWFGTAAERFLSAAGSDPEALMNWSDLSLSLRLGSDLLIKKAAIECRGIAAAGCVTTEVGRALLLPPHAVDGCSVLSGPHLQVQCIVRVFLIDLIQTSLLFVG